MAASIFRDNVWMTVTGTPGTGSVTLNAALAGYQTAASAGVANGELNTWKFQDGTAWEISPCTYTTSGTSIARSTFRSSSTGSKISLTSAATCAIVDASADIAAIDLTNVAASDFAAAASSAGTITLVPSFTNLKGSAPGGAKVATLTADFVSLLASTTIQQASSVSLTPSLASSGANGLDTGAVAANTWYSTWIIGNGSTTAGLLSLSTTAPTMPGGYSYKLRTGWVRTDGSSNIKAFTQHGPNFQYVSNAGFPIIVQGTAGTINGVGGLNTGAVTSVSGFVPTTAAVINVNTFCFSVTGSSYIVLSANANGSGYYNGSPSGSYQGDFVNRTSTSNTPFAIQLESTNIYIVSGNSSNAVYCQGWVDNL